MKCVYRIQACDLAKDDQVNIQAEVVRSSDTPTELEMDPANGEQTISQIVSYLNDIGGKQQPIDWEDSRDDDWDYVEEALEEDLLWEFPYVEAKLNMSKQASQRSPERPGCCR